MSLNQKYDTPEWREQRYFRLQEWFQGDESAIEFVTTLGQIAELWDDLIDKDTHLSDREINDGFLAALITLPANEFFYRHRLFFMPLIISWTSAWMDSVKLERGNSNDRIYAITMRDIYLQVVPMVVRILRGAKVAEEMSLESWRFFTDHEDALTWVDDAEYEMN